MRKTDNYSLPRWEKTDRIMMDDFNNMTQKIDAGIAQAQETAQTAQAAAEAARAKAEILPYVLGSYYGTGVGRENPITLGFRPSAVFISGESAISMSETPERNYHALLCPYHMTRVANLTETGFIINGTIGHYPILNEKDIRYTYIALR